MPDALALAVIFAPAAFVAIAGTWVLRRLRATRRAEVERDREWDTAHGITEGSTR